jgi:glutamate racemase
VSVVGIFDSGVGGLTVQKAILERLPGLDTVYLGDTARVPYGSKSPEVVTQYSLKNARFLAAREIDLLVVACNTASAVALPALRSELGIPVLGVVEPGARAAARASRSARAATSASWTPMRFTATARSSRSSWASQTTPKPPAPRRRSSR